MAVRDHGLEVLKKAGEETVPGQKGDMFIKVGAKPGGMRVVDSASAALLQLQYGEIQNENIDLYLVNNNGEILFNDAGQLLVEV